MKTHINVSTYDLYIIQGDNVEYCEIKIINIRHTQKWPIGTDRNPQLRLVHPYAENFGM